MKLLFCCAGTKPALPAADVAVWEPGAPAADYAVVWAPPQAFLDEQPGLKAVFNIGAGVDALLKLRLPPTARVVRLDDAGMSVQMAEYVCHAVIRHYREFDGYEADVRQGRWSYRKPRSRADFAVGVMGLGVLGSRVAQAQDILRRETLSRLQPGGCVINVARGAHLVDEDLLALLDEGHLAGATLDVFRTEPLPAGHPFWAHPKITVTPHTSARTLRDESIAQIAGKIRALEQGEPIAGIVDPVRGY